jgi:phosphoglycerate dehydrogenase-like enzyme
MTRVRRPALGTTLSAALALLLVLPAAHASAQSTAAAPAPTLEAALAEYQLRESTKPVRDLIPGWTKPRKLVVTIDKPERTAWLQQAMPAGVKVVGTAREADTSAADLADTNALVLSGCQPNTLSKAPKLKWVHAGGAGSDQCLVDERIAHGDILLTNSQKVKNTILAEMAIAYTLTLSRSVDVALANQRLHQLGAPGRPGKQLEGSTMLIVGLGGAGTEIARIAHAMGMKVIATRNSSHEGPDFVSYVGLADELPDLLGQADVVIVCAPLTPATRGLFDTAMLARMKKDAILINWTRAEITPAEDLAAALKAGTIGSAALNWATSAPLTPDHPLWSAPNLILAPWTGPGGGAQANKANQDQTQVEMRWLVIRENMRRFALGERMYSVFDLERGY